MSVSSYRRKRDFQRTPEPRPKVSSRKDKQPLFVVQRHDASHLHYDFRIEVNGLLVSWAVPKGLPTKLGVKRLALQTEDHPYEYAFFEGKIPQGEYGAGTVVIWDRGTYLNLKHDASGREISMATCHKRGQIEIYLQGTRYKAGYALIHTRDNQWLMVKMRAATVRERLLRGADAKT